MFSTEEANRRWGCPTCSDLHTCTDTRRVRRLWWSFRRPPWGTRTRTPGASSLPCPWLNSADIRVERARCKTFRWELAVAKCRTKLASCCGKGRGLSLCFVRTPWLRGKCSPGWGCRPCRTRPPWLRCSWPRLFLLFRKHPFRSSNTSRFCWRIFKQISNLLPLLQKKYPN